jgi:regulator of RNase E activity RraA
LRNFPKIIRKFSGKMGEMTSWFFKRGGANGLVVDGYIRDYDGLSGILDYAVCSRGTSSVDSAIRWRYCYSCKNC